ncbi:hypothetical protein H7347_07230 [Corynebacterium sp. zg-331]|uniref:hypothetical protein n=1 Tax=unclassified Corynebacterium TaxID=2624378 RepID=UPI00128C33A8|nr:MULTISPECIES: hypothetical protein [unclassified Corynebacterium]MBC3186365.1 hypothetical protein [Corynebacterium sp. zg-331]MPV52852.1 hypothetical protein [Corynebacterium sp. zg331]
MSNITAPSETPRDVEQEAITDAAPALAGVGPEFLPAEAAEGVDVESMPPLKELSRLLPSKRTKIKAQVASIAQRAQGVDALRVEGVDESVLLNHLGEVADMIEAAETFVLDMAQDRDAMEAWLIEQEQGESAVMLAFSKASEALGN